MKKVLVLLVAVLLTVPAVAQWSEEQAAVWSFVEKSWVDDADETGEWPTGYAVEAYSSWGDEDALPDNLSESDASVRYGDETGTTRFYQIKPVTINIDGDTAVVNYYATVVSEDSEGETERDVSAISETLVRRNGEWRYLASAGWSPDLD